MSPNTITNLYRCSVESILTGSSWPGMQEDAESGGLSPSIRHTALPSIESIYTKPCLKMVASIIKDLHYLCHMLLSVQPSGRRYKSLEVPHHRVHEQLLSHDCQVLETICTTLTLPQPHFTTDHLLHYCGCFNFLIMFLH